MAAQQRELLAHREPHRVLVRERATARREQHDGGPGAQVVHRLEERLRLEDHPRPAAVGGVVHGAVPRSEEHTSELQSQSNLVCRLLLEKKKKKRLTVNTEA